MKNTLAIIQSIAMQTLRGEDTSPEVREAFMARLMALADAHDILTADSDEAGHAFQEEAGHWFRFEAGHHSDLKSAVLGIGHAGRIG